MIIKIENPNREIPWIAIETDHIVSIAPSTRQAPNHCFVSMVDRDNFYLENKLAEKLLATLKAKTL